MDFNSLKADVPNNMDDSYVNISTSPNNSNNNDTTQEINDAIQMVKDETNVSIRTDSAGTSVLNKDNNNNINNNINMYDDLTNELREIENEQNMDKLAVKKAKKQMKINRKKLDTIRDNDDTDTDLYTITTKNTDNDSGSIIPDTITTAGIDGWNSNDNNNDHNSDNINDDDNKNWQNIKTPVIERQIRQYGYDIKSTNDRDKRKYMIMGAGMAVAGVVVIGVIYITYQKLTKCMYILY